MDCGFANDNPRCIFWRFSKTFWKFLLKGGVTSLLLQIPFFYEITFTKLKQGFKGYLSNGDAFFKSWILISLNLCTSKIEKVGSETFLKFKSGTHIIIFLHCFTYFVLDKYIYIYIYIYIYKYIYIYIYIYIYVYIYSSPIFVKSLMSRLVFLIWWRIERSMEHVWRPTCPTIHETKQFHLSHVSLVWQPKSWA